MLSLKYLGITIAIISLFLMVLGFVYIRSLETALITGHELNEQGSCVHPHGEVCPYQQLNQLAIFKYTGIFLLLVLLSTGIFLTFKKTPEQKAKAHARTISHQLGTDEQKIVDILLQNNTILFQHELVEKLGVSKVRVTRLLDKLEAQGLIERRRRGMTNAIFLK